MTDSSGSTTPGFSDLMGLFGGTNPLSLIGKSVNQFQTGVTNFLKSIENFNETMEQMNGVAMRINRMLDELEPVMKSALPQLTRTLKAADDMVEQLSVPVDRVAPALMRLSETLSSPVLTSFPKDLGQVVEIFNDVARRMQPLGQLAETAGGFFNLNPLAALRPSRSAAPPPDPAPVAPVLEVLEHEEPHATAKSIPRKSGAKKTAAKKTGARKTAAKSKAAKKSATK